MENVWIKIKDTRKYGLLGGIMEDFIRQDQESSGDGANPRGILL